MEKTLTVSIAAYNVEKYIVNTLDSLLVNSIDDLEILVEDDGGTDGTAEIVKEYEKKYPGIVKLVHKENGGYGSTINKSIELAKGKYFKQLDGDDWYDSKKFENFLELLRKIDVDLVYTPYKEFYENKNRYNLKDYFSNKLEKEYNIEDAILETEHHLNMYTVCYKTEILRKSRVKLLEKCFYTDTQYAMYPISYCNTIYITHLPLYIYRLGNDGQSVSLNGQIKHYKDHVRVSKDIINFYNNSKFSKNIQKYLLNYASNHVANTIAGFYMVLEANKQNLKQIKDFEAYILKNSKVISNKLAKTSKVVRILRKTNYNYIVYMILCKLKKRKIKNRTK